MPILLLRDLRVPSWSTAFAVQVIAAHFLTTIASRRLPMVLTTLAAAGAVIAAVVAVMTIRKVRQARKVFYFHDDS